MRTTVLKEAFKRGLGATGRIAQKSLALPILNSVLLEAEKNFLCLMATDLEIGIKWWLLSKTEKEGKFACPLRFLQSLVEYFPEEKLILSSEGKKIWLETKSFRAQVNGADPEDFPIIPEPETKTVFPIQADQFIEGLSQVIEMAATSTIKPEIAGVCFHFFGNRLKMVATDSFRLAEKTILLEKAVDPEASFILPQRACRELINVFDEEGGVLELHLSSNQVLVGTQMAETPHPKIHFSSRLIEGEYPNYQEIIPQKFKFTATVFKNEFLQNLKAVSLFANKINEVRLRIDPDKQEIEFEGQNPEIGQSVSQLSSKIEGEKTEAAFNWRFLAEGLNQIKEKELVFALGKDEGPAILRPREDQSYFCLVMPLRT